ncbi:uncharacterized protein LOC144133803 [Amblyomma americanum]
MAEIAYLKGSPRVWLRGGAMPFGAPSVAVVLYSWRPQLRRTGTATGSPGVPQQFYWQLHSFLGSLSINDDGRVEESLELPVVNEVPGTTEVLASGEDEPLGDRADPQLLSTSPLAVLPSTNGTMGCSNRGGTSGGGRSRRKRDSSSVVHQLLALHKDEAAQAVKAEKRAHKFRKKMLRMTEEVALASN